MLWLPWMREVLVQCEEREKGEEEKVYQITVPCLDMIRAKKLVGMQDIFGYHLMQNEKSCAYHISTKNKHNTVNFLEVYPPKSYTPLSDHVKR